MMCQGKSPLLSVFSCSREITWIFAECFHGIMFYRDRFCLQPLSEAFECLTSVFIKYLNTGLSCGGGGTEHSLLALCLGLCKKMFITYISLLIVIFVFPLAISLRGMLLSSPLYGWIVERRNSCPRPQKIRGERYLAVAQSPYIPQWCLTGCWGKN